MKSTLPKIPTQKDIPYQENQEVVTDGHITINKNGEQDQLNDYWEGGYEGFVGEGSLTVKISTAAVESALQVLFPWDMFVVHGVKLVSGVWTIQYTQAHNFFEFVHVRSDQYVDVVLLNAIKRIWTGTIRYANIISNKKKNLRWWFNTKKYEPFFCTNPESQAYNTFDSSLLDDFKPLVLAEPTLAKTWLVLTTYQPYVFPDEPQTLFDTSVFDTLRNSVNVRMESSFGDQFLIIDYNDQLVNPGTPPCYLPHKKPPELNPPGQIDFVVTIPTSEPNLDFIKAPTF